MLFCAGMSQAKDIVAHELAHLVTRSTARLEYHDQPGALNESYSDIFGALVDGNWVIGEGYPHNDVKEIRRYLDNPHASPSGWQPDSIGEYLDMSADYGGVHYNSGIWSRVAVLIADGGTFHSGTVTGIGRQKLALISYATLTTRLVATSGFYEAADETLDACYDLSKRLPSMVTYADCYNTVMLALVSAGLLPH